MYTKFEYSSFNTFFHLLCRQTDRQIDRQPTSKLIFHPQACAIIVMAHSTVLTDTFQVNLG